MVYCRAWSNCSTNVQRDNCKLYDLFTQVLQYPTWSPFRSYDAVQQRYVTVIDAVDYLCTNVEPGIDREHVSHRDYDYKKVSYQKQIAHQF